MGDQWTKREALSYAQSTLLEAVVKRALAGGRYMIGEDGIPDPRTIQVLERRGLICGEGAQLDLSYGVCIALSAAGVELDR